MKDGKKRTSYHGYISNRELGDERAYYKNETNTGGTEDMRDVTEFKDDGPRSDDMYSRVARMNINRCLPLPHTAHMSALDPYP